MEIGNQMQNHKIASLYMNMESFDQLQFLSKL